MSRVCHGWKGRIIPCEGGKMERILTDQMKLKNDTHCSSLYVLLACDLLVHCRIVLKRRKKRKKKKQRKKKKKGRYRSRLHITACKTTQTMHWTQCSCSCSDGTFCFCLFRPCPYKCHCHCVPLAVLRSFFFSLSLHKREEKRAKNATWCLHGWWCRCYK
ncbi:hypothetical protein GE21DRAFT_1121554 [Neurospora crassa]|nr:hypothetical protein GE21DRAFT_1121554 [Neurospora crassa]